MAPNPRDQLAPGQPIPLDRVREVIANALRPVLAHGAHRVETAALVLERLVYFRLLADDVARPPCVNDTDGDGDCAACARNPNAPCRRLPATGGRQ